MHRDGSGNRIEDIQAARAEWQAQGKSKTTYCNKREWDAWHEDIGNLVHTDAEGFQIRQNATIKTTAPGGTPKIIHNCVIVGNPAVYAQWLKESDAALAEARQTNPDAVKSTWMPEWTYYTASYLPTLLDKYK